MRPILIVAASSLAAVAALFFAVTHTGGDPEPEPACREPVERVEGPGPDHPETGRSSSQAPASAQTGGHVDTQPGPAPERNRGDVSAPGDTARHGSTDVADVTAEAATEDPPPEREVIRKFRRLVQGVAELSAGGRNAEHVAAWKDRVEPAWDRFAAEVRAKVPTLAAEMSEGTDLEPDPPELTDEVIYAAACHVRGHRDRVIDKLALAVAVIPDAGPSYDLDAYELANAIAVSATFKHDKLWRVLHDLD